MNKRCVKCGKYFTPDKPYQRRCPKCQSEFMETHYRMGASVNEGEWFRGLRKWKNLYVGVELYYDNEQLSPDRCVYERRLSDIIEEMKELQELAVRYGFDTEEIEAIYGCFET